MNLYLRLLWTILRAFFKPAIKAGETITLSLRVLPNDLDINAHMNNGRYLTIVDLALFEYFIRAGLFREMRKRGWRPMLGGSIVHYRRGLEVFQKYDLRFGLMCWDERWSYLGFSFERGGKVCASGITKGALVGKDGFVDNNEAYAAGGVDHPSPAAPEAVQRWREADRAVMDGLPL